MRHALVLTLFIAVTFGAGVFNIENYGAKGDGTTDNTAAFAKAIAACAAAGGGQVVVPKGTFLTGTVNLTSNMMLNVQDGATILGSTDESVYPLIPALPSYPIETGNTAVRYAPLIYAENCVNVTVTGAGSIDGNGVVWYKRYETHELNYTRPPLIQFRYTKDISILQITLLNSAYYTVHLYTCLNVLVDGITIDDPVVSANLDGVDPDSTSNVIIRNCNIASGDDSISMKAGASTEGIAYNVPTENITIVNNKITRGGGIAIGSETSGSVRNVLVANNDVALSGDLVRFKSCPTYGGVVENIVYTNMTITGGGTGIFIDLDYECPGTPGL